MRKVIFMTAALMISVAPQQLLAASLVAKINISTQTMTVTQDGLVIHKWRVSTARRGYVTPRGTWRPVRMNRMWYSRKYDMTPMPYAVFFRGGYAIHGTNAVRHLGRPVSHGCVRLATGNAAQFFSLVQRYGPGDTRIIVTN
jgi:lipoprotein-anchoring transpeptidase ErfK/SrfK